MAFDKSEIMHWNAEEKRTLAFELLDSIDEEIINQEIPAWKKELIAERIKKDNLPQTDAITWAALRNKYIAL